ncbi:THO2 plays a role in transcriptional elongation [Microbotryomycetes sp. JL201]|nr:THO2 plays a role in transcriptional elongation [Microbotryomycetes sp. JL201]
MASGEDGDSAAAELRRLTPSLLSLIQQSVSSSASVVHLYSQLAELVRGCIAPARQQPRTSAHDVATYVSSDLVAALKEEQQDDDAAVAQLADALIDVVWQLDQEIESGIYHARELVHDDMHVDVVGPTPSSAGGDATLADPAAAQLQQVNQAADNQNRTELARLVKLLIDSQVLSSQACAERLDTLLLALPTLRLVPDFRTFSRLEVSYKQQKFNLMREESEGYAKLSIEILGNLGPPHSLDNGQPQEPERSRLARANRVVDSIKSLIGNFDLDPDRCLDIILDAFSDELENHYQFFLDLLRVSPWAPRSSHASKDQGQGKGKAKDVPLDVGIEDEQGRSLIAQILGFKFTYYQGDGVEPASDRLFVMTALLIWHGFVKLADLWTHLSPEDEILAKVETEYRDEQDKLARSVGGANALAMAGALVDDDATTSATTTQSTADAAAEAAASATPRQLPNQKLDMLRALLTVGDLKHAMFIVAQYPYLVPANPDVADLLNRALSVSIEPAYASLSVYDNNVEYQDSFTATKSKYVAPDKRSQTTLPLAPTVRKPTHLTYKAFPDPHKEVTFFFSAWRDHIPRCDSWESALSLLEALYLPVIGVHISRDLCLYSKICKIVAADLGVSSKSWTMARQGTDFALQQPSLENPRLARWIDVLRQYLMPSLSLLKDNSAAALQLWTVLSLFPIEKRFQFYGEWKDTLYRRIPALAVRKAEAERDVKSILRRLSTDNAKKLGKTLAKAAHTNPTIIFAIALNQVQSYDNLIVPVVEAARYLTEFGYDVLTYSLLDALSSSRSKTKEDGTSVALWLQGLATFTGQLYRRWPAMAPSLWIVIQYLVNQLASGSSKDLIVLREIITRMTNIEPFADLSDAQVMSLAGGKVLRSEVFSQTDIGQASKKVQTSMVAAARERLSKSFRSSGLAMPLLVNIAMHIKGATSTDAHLKSLGALYDQNHAVLFQFIEFLTALFEPEELGEMVPAVDELLSRYGLDAEDAFDIGRPKLRLAMKAHDEKEATRIASEQKKKANLAAKLAKERERANKFGLEGTPAAADVRSDPVKAKLDEVKIEDVEMVDVKPEGTVGAHGVEELVTANANGASDVIMQDAAVVTPEPITKTPPSPWHPGLLETIEMIQNVLPEEVNNSMGAPFFTTFWQLTLFDIVYPKERYEAELTRLRTMQREASASTAIKTEDKDKFIKHVVELANRLTDEAVKHASARGLTNRRLNREAKHWFPYDHHATRPKREKIADMLYQYCFFPRAKLSLPDAVFTYQWIKRMHSMNTPGFHTAVIFDKILSQSVSPLLFSLSENEARNYAQFLHDLLKDVSSWYKDEKLYKAEAIPSNLNGFTRSYPAAPAGAAPKPGAIIDFTAFQGLVQKWHKGLVVSFARALESSDYMAIKNAVLVFTKLAPVYPLVYSDGMKLDKAVSDHLATEKREDLTILAQGYKAILTKRRKTWLGQPAKAGSASPAPSKASTPGPSEPHAVEPVSKVESTESTKDQSVPAGPALSSSAPRHSLPARPGSALDSRSPAPTRAPDSEPRSPGPTIPSRPHEPPSRPGSALGNRFANPNVPPRSNTPVSTSNTASNTPTTAERLRQEALGTRRGTQQGGAGTQTTMDPPPAPSAATRFANPGRSVSSSVVPTEASSTTTTSTQNQPRAPSAPSSRTTSPDRTDSSIRKDRDRERGRDSERDRDVGRQRADRSRDHSADSSQSGSRGVKRDSSGRETLTTNDRRPDDRDGARNGRRDDRRRVSNHEDETHLSSRRSDRSAWRGDDESSTSRREERNSRRGEEDGRHSRREEDSRSSRREEGRVSAASSRRERDRERERDKERTRDSRGSRTDDRNSGETTSTRSDSRTDRARTRDRDRDSDRDRLRDRPDSDNVRDRRTVSDTSRPDPLPSATVRETESAPTSAPLPFQLSIKGGGGGASGGRGPKSPVEHQSTSRNGPETDGTSKRRRVDNDSIESPRNEPSGATDGGSTTLSLSSRLSPAVNTLPPRPSSSSSRQESSGGASDDRFAGGRRGGGDDRGDRRRFGSRRQ